MSGIWKKLNLKDQTTIFVINAPSSFEPALKELSDRDARRKLSAASSTSRR